MAIRFYWHRTIYKLSSKVCMLEEELQQSINRFPEVSEESLNEMREKNVNKNTKKSTATWMKV